MHNRNKVIEKLKQKYKCIKWSEDKKATVISKFVNLLGMLGYYLYSIAKSAMNSHILNQIILIYEKSTLNLCWKKTM